MSLLSCGGGDEGGEAPRAPAAPVDWPAGLADAGMAGGFSLAQWPNRKLRWCLLEAVQPWCPCSSHPQQACRCAQRSARGTHLAAEAQRLLLQCPADSEWEEDETGDWVDQEEEEWQLPDGLALAAGSQEEGHAASQEAEQQVEAGVQPGPLGLVAADEEQLELELSALSQGQVRRGRATWAVACWLGCQRPGRGRGRGGGCGQWYTPCAS
jgi:hypothetical protein